jgi:hypothetical protein
MAGGFQRKATLFPREERTEAINIDESDGSEDDLDQYEVNMDQGANGKKKQYKRIYDSKYKFPTEKKPVGHFAIRREPTSKAV